MFDHDRETHRLLRELIEKVEKIEHYLFRAKSATLTFKGENTMPATIVVGGKGAQAVFTEFDGPNGTGNKVAPAGNVIFESDNTGAATVNPSSGAITAVGAGTANISGLDQGNQITAQDQVTVTAAPPPPTAQSATLVIAAN